ncbi:MAG: hypothetical protein FJX77_16290, partial [Armatimonadetes bacterium]|nr:hypothetical protein [Armatimonadota bacterium]
SGTTEETRATEGFYLNRRPAVAEALPAALEEIRRSWLNGDFTKMSARFRLEGKVRVFPRGQFKYAVDTKEFTTMLKEAMARIDTLAFAFHAPRALRPDRVFVTGRHLFLDADKIRQETNISYVLERTDGRWFIVEAGSSNAPIVDHQE